MTDFKELDINNAVKPGLVNEYFMYELNKVLKNIADENTEPGAVRKIKLEFDLKADHNRMNIDIDVRSSSSLAGLRKQRGHAVIASRGDIVKAYSSNHHQPAIMDDEVGPSVVHEGGKSA